MATEAQAPWRAASAPASWAVPLAMFVGVLLLLLVVFHTTYWSLVATWIRSETFAHGFLIVPIVLFLVWLRREEVIWQARPRPFLPAALPLLLLAAAWVLGELVDVLSVRQFAVVLMIPALVWLVLGSRVVWILKFPLAYLLFAVPFGEFLVQPMMVFTADFTITLVRWSGVPVYREGMDFSLPTGNWSVVEACSGVRYLIASFALGCLYQYLMYRSWRRRLAFLAASLIVPVVANGLRAYFIVMLGHLSDMSLAAGVDHLLYGWLFFGVVITLLFWAGSYWREDGAQDRGRPTTGYSAALRARGPAGAVAPAFAAVVLAAVVILSAPLYTGWMGRNAGDAVPPLDLSGAAAEGWERATPPADWRPGYHGARDEWHAGFRRGGQEVGVYVGLYADQARNGKMAAWENTLAGRDRPGWRERRAGHAEAAEAAGRRALLTGPDRRIVAWQWYWVDGRLTASRHLVKGLEALSMLRGRGDAAANIVIFAAYRDSPDEVEAALAEFAEASLPHIRDRLDGRAAQ